MGKGNWQQYATSRKHRKAIKRMKKGDPVAANLDLTIWDLQVLTKIVTVYDKKHTTSPDLEDKYVHRIGGGQMRLCVSDVMVLKSKLEKLEQFLKDQHRIMNEIESAETASIVQEHLEMMERRDAKTSTNTQDAY